MTLDLSTNARKLIIESPAGEELATFAEWLYAERNVELHISGGTGTSLKTCPAPIDPA
jgi:hypothetical protein